MYTIEETIKIISDANNAITTFAEILSSTNVTRKDIEPLLKIAPKVKTSLVRLDQFFTNTKPVKIVTLGRDEIKVSNTGKFYRLNGEELIPFWCDGDMRIKISADNIKRCAALVCVAFGIKTYDRNSFFIIDYKDGDRRNLTPENLFWVKPTSNKDDRLKLVEDICLRIIEFDGDIDLISEQYIDSVPKVSREYIESIMRKEAHKEISDLYFHIDDEGNIIPISIEYGNNCGVDCYGLLVNTKDVGLTCNMIVEKINHNQKISKQEKEIMILVSIPKHTPNPDDLNDAIKSEFGIDIPKDEIAGIIKSKGSTYELIKSIINGGNNNG